MIYHEETESNTQTSDQIIHVFALFTFSSSPPDKRYKIPLTIKDITAITATYLIPSAISSATKFIGDSRFVSESHHGRSPQWILGAAKAEVINVTEITRTEKRYFIVLLV